MIEDLEMLAERLSQKVDFLTKRERAVYKNALIESYIKIQKMSVPDVIYK